MSDDAQFYIEILENASSKDPHELEHELLGLANAAERSEAVAEEFAKNDGIPLLISLLRHRKIYVREEAAGALAELTTYNLCRDYVVKAGGIKQLIKQLRPKSMRAKSIKMKHAARALANLAGGLEDDKCHEDDKIRMKIAEQGGITALIKWLKFMLNPSTTHDDDSDGDPELLDECKSEAARALAMLSNNDENKVKIAEEGGIRTLLNLLADGDYASDYKVEAADALMNMSQNPEIQVKIAEAGGIKKLIRMLELNRLRVFERDTRLFERETVISTVSLTVAVVQLLLNLAQNDTNSVMIAAEDGVKELVALLIAGPPIVRTKAAAALAYLAGNDENRVTIAEEGGIKPLVTMLTHDDDDDKEHSAECLQNLAENEEIAATIASEGGINLLISLLSSDNDAATPGNLRRVTGGRLKL